MIDTAILRVEFVSYWTAGSGKGEGSGADELIVRTPGGLPYLPGRSLAGLIRDALHLARAAGQVAEGRPAELLGERSSATPEEPGKMGLGRFEAGTEGKLSVTSAFLSSRAFAAEEREAAEAWASEPANAAALAQLTRFLESTAIDDRGLARHRSLRTVEAAVPMALFAALSAEAGAGDWKRDLERALPLLRSAGSRRSRGFGRCTAALEPGTTAGAGR